MVGQSRIIEGQKQIEKLIKQSIEKQFTRTLAQASIPIERRIRLLIKDAITSSKEYNSLLNGQLKSELGLRGANDKLTIILRQWTQSIIVKITKVKFHGSTIRGVMKIEAIKGDWMDVLSLPQALQITEKGQPLPWLNWLLTQGSKIIIQEYSVVPGRGRAGPYIMEKGSGWRVPPEFSGTTNNNFVTRAINNVRSEFIQIIKEEITRKFT